MQPSREQAYASAQRQLRRVLLSLAALDIGVIVLVFTLAEARLLLHVANLELGTFLVGRIALVLITRIYMAFLLRPRSTIPFRETSSK